MIWDLKSEINLELAINSEFTMKDSFSEKGSEKLYEFIQIKKLLREFFVLHKFKRNSVSLFLHFTLSILNSKL